MEKKSRTKNQAMMLKPSKTCDKQTIKSTRIKKKVTDGKETNAKAKCGGSGQLRTVSVT